MIKEISLSYTEPQLRVINSNKKYVIVLKGRRFGFTHGIAKWAIELLLEGKKVLWGDTIHPNIDRYVERYFIPELKRLGLTFNYNSQRKILTIDDFKGWVDFRSADKPENWEGFGYDTIILNEAGIILNNDYLYTNVVLPMLIDYQGTQLIAGGVPKGKINRRKKKHAFYQLYENANNHDPNYELFQFSSYDNPLLKKEDIQELENEIRKMNPAMVRQEIYGEFVDGAGGLLWDDIIIESCRIDKAPPNLRIVIAIDPAVSNESTSDETGIIAVGYDGKRAYVLQDASGRYTPNEWARQAMQLRLKWQADYYVAEVNQGGDMVEEVIRQVDPNAYVRKVRASKGKFIRAEPVFSLYEQGLIKHVHGLAHLEAQMRDFNPNEAGSPDRVDALVWGIHDLVLQGVGEPMIF